MPLLELEPFISSEELLSAPVPPSEKEAPWWVVHTRPRVEKALARKLYETGRAFFLPLHKNRWYANGRWRTSYLPLFPGYLFVRGDGALRDFVLATNQVAHVLPVADQAGLHADLFAVYRAMQSGLLMAPEERLCPGSPVEIVAGALKGLKGTVLRRDKETRFVIEVRFLQRGVSVAIEGWMLRPLVSPAPRAS
jgi:transcription antitermination factor NusG